MKTFCLNIIINSPLCEENLNSFFSLNIFEGNIRYCNLISTENFKIKSYLDYFLSKNINFETISNKYDTFLDLNEIINFSNKKHTNNGVNLTNIIIESDTIYFNEKNEIFKDIDTDQTYYIRHEENNIAFSRLFIYTQNDKISNPFLHYYLLDDDNNKYTNFISLYSKSDYNRNKYLLQTQNIYSKNIDHKEYFYYYFVFYLLSDFNNIILFYNLFQNEKKLFEYIVKKWSFNYISLVAFYNQGNFKKSIEIGNNCIQLDKTRIEPFYILSKIAQNKNEIDKAQNIINNYAGKNIPICNKYLCELTIYKFFIHLQSILLYKNSKNMKKVHEISMFLLNNGLNKSQYNIISTILSNNIDKNVFINQQFNFNSKLELGIDSLVYNDYNSYYIKFKEELYNIGFNKGLRIILHKNDKNQEYIIKDTNHLKNFSCFNYKNKYILITNIDELCYNIYKLDTNNFKLDKFLVYKLEPTYKNVVYSSKILYINDIYLGLVSCFNNKLYKFIYYDKSTLKPLYSSSLFKISNNSIVDIDCKNNEIILIPKEPYSVYTIKNTDLYFEFNAPFIFNENISIEIDKNIPINIDTIGYKLNKNTYKNYHISDLNSKFNIKYDFFNDIAEIKSLGVNIKLDRFIFLENKVELYEKKYDITYFHADTIEPKLKERLEKEYKVSDNLEIEKSKYLLINNREFEGLTTDKLSYIIQNNTLIISLIDEEDIENSNFGKLYSNNKSLNKLILFNIVKNDEYINFIINEILDKDEYNSRIQYIDEFISELYEEYNIFDISFKIFKDTREKLKSIENEFKNNEYKSILMTKISQNTNNIALLDIIKHIILYNQDIDIFYNIDIIPEIIIKTNLFSDCIDINEFDEIFDIGTVRCILLVKTIEDGKLYSRICSNNSIIYIEDRDIIYYT